MPDANQAQIEENSASNKNPAPTKTYGQSTVYSTLPQGPNVSGSGRANLPPEPILGPTKPSPEPNASETQQFESIHPELKPLSDLTGGVTKEANQTFQYGKSQPMQEEPLRLSETNNEDMTGLVGIKASEFTKNGVTTTITEVPAVSFEPLTTREKLVEAEGSLQVKNMGGEAVSVARFPFSGSKVYNEALTSLGLAPTGIKATNENEPLVQSTSLTDLLGVTPVGGGELAKGAELAEKGLSKLAGKDVLTVASKIEPAFQEDTLEVRKEAVSKGVMQLTQGTEQEITLTGLKVEKAPLQIRATETEVSKSTEPLTGQTIEDLVPKAGSKVEAVQPQLPKGITLTKTVEGVGKVGETTIAHEPTSEEIANRYPLFGKGQNDLSDLTKTEVPKEIPPTEQKPVFGKITEEIPNVIDITKQAAKSGQAELAEAFVSEKQVAFTRSPSELEENKIIITGKPSPEIISTFGLKLVSGSKNVFISGDLTKGMKEYLLGAEKAGLITPRLSETHVQSVKDVLTNAKLYTKASKEPKLFETYPEIVRPQVIGTRESYLMKTQILKKGTDELRSFKKMQPFGPIKESKGVAGSAGKAKALLEQKPEAKTLNRPEVFKTEKETGKGSFENIVAAKGVTTSLETLAYPKGTDSKFLQSFRTKQEEENTQITRSVQGIDILNKNISDTLSVSKQDEMSLISLMSKSELTSKQESGLISRQSEDQITGLTTKQTTTQITTTGNPPPPNITTNQNPPPPIITEQKKKGKKKKLKQFKAKDINFLGASTESTVVGLTGREELTYGNKNTAKLLSKGRKLEKGQNFISYTKRVISYKPTKQLINKRTNLIIKKGKTPKF